MDPIKLTENQWLLMRENFNEEERRALLQALVGEKMCPKTWYFDPEKLTGDLAEKVRTA